MIRRRLYEFESLSNGSGEVDLRAWFDRIVYGADGHIQHGHWLVIRRLRRDSNGVPEACVCKDSLTKDPTPGCSYCLGEGYLWDEEWKLGYSMYVGADGGLTRKNIHLPMGVLRVDYKVFFFRYDLDLLYGDKVVEVKLNQEGQIVTPYKRKAVYQPETIQEYRSDNGRIEYIAVWCREDDAIRSDYV